tara:strand:- start:7 stop:345 length:339 start_codon:yes stop_codon:yes gene_type:complete
MRHKLCFAGEYHNLDHHKTPRETALEPPDTEKSCNKSSTSAVYGFDDALYIWVFTQQHANFVNSAYPGVKVIVLLREPIQRAYSAFKMDVGRDHLVWRQKTIRCWRSGRTVG